MALWITLLLIADAPGLSRAEWLTVIFSGGGAIVMGAVYLLSIGSLKGTLVTKLAEHDGDISDLKAEQVRQWNDITDYGQRIASLEGSKSNGKAWGHHG